MNDAKESISQFEKRKQDHIQLALKDENQAHGSGLERIHLIHEALPAYDFAEIDISIQSLGKNWATPFLVSSMTAGHPDSVNINTILAEACAAKNWVMGVGSQRRQLQDETAIQEWLEIRQRIPHIRLFANLGIAQAITATSDQIRKLCDSLQAEGLFIHLNPLQECLQPEGTPHFKGGLKAIEGVCKDLDIPVIIKETGCGFSEKTLKRLDNLGIAAVDLSGFGGTHWGRIEGERADQNLYKSAAKTFANWGISTLDSLFNAMFVKPSYEIWASGGIRNGLDAAKVLAIGAKRVGLAKPMLEVALKGVEAVMERMEQLEFELRIALFCTGQSTLSEMQENQVWQIKT